jgi:hypothetical protein
MSFECKSMFSFGINTFNKKLILSMSYNIINLPNPFKMSSIELVYLAQFLSINHLKTKTIIEFGPIQSTCAS